MTITFPQITLIYADENFPTNYSHVSWWTNGHTNYLHVWWRKLHNDWSSNLRSKGPAFHFALLPKDNNNNNRKTRTNYLHIWWRKVPTSWVLLGVRRSPSPRVQSTYRRDLPELRYHPHMLSASSGGSSFPISYPPRSRYSDCVGRTPAWRRSRGPSFRIPSRPWIPPISRRPYRRRSCSRWWLSSVLASSGSPTDISVYRGSSRWPRDWSGNLVDPWSEPNPSMSIPSVYW